MIKVEIKIKRANGEIETVISDNRMLLVDWFQVKAMKNTKDAGKGEILSFKKIEDKYIFSKKQIEEQKEEAEYHARRKLIMQH